MPSKADQSKIWDYFKPRHTHAWNMLVLSWRYLEQYNEDDSEPFDCEYHWENFIIRLWLYRVTVRTLTKINAIETEAKFALKSFDDVFTIDEKHHLQAIRDMYEHFDDYAAGKGRGPIIRERDLDPWRLITRDRYERGKFYLDRRVSYDAAIQLRIDTKNASDKFVK